MLETKCVNCTIDMELPYTLKLKRAYCSVCGVIFEYVCTENYWLSFDGEKLLGQFLLITDGDYFNNKVRPIFRKKVTVGKKFLMLHDVLSKCNKFDNSAIYNINIKEVK